MVTSTSRLIALLFLLIFGGGGSVAFTLSLARRAREKTHPIRGLSSVALGCLGFLLLWYSFPFTQTSSQFMRALREGDEMTAFSLLDADLQGELEGQAAFTEWAAPLTPQQWFFASACNRRGVARSNGIGQFENGEPFNVSFHLRRGDEGWIIQGIEFWELGPAYQVGTSSELDCWD